MKGGAGLLPLLMAVPLLALATALGIAPMKKILVMREARHELRHGSAGALRALAGWSVIAFWAMAVWFLATILGDWQMTGDLDGALERAMLRLRVLLEIAAAIADSD